MSIVRENKIILLIVALFLTPQVSYAAYTECKVTKKVHPTGVYTQEYINRVKPSVILSKSETKTIFARCDLDGCDTYTVDMIKMSGFFNPAKKYYHFKSHFDVQIFQDMTFIENNGRGSISFGKCEMVTEIERILK